MNFRRSQKVHFVALLEYKTPPKPVINSNGGFSISGSSVTSTFDADVIGCINQKAVSEAQEKYLEMNPEYSKCLILSWQRYEEECE